MVYFLDNTNLSKINYYSLNKPQEDNTKGFNGTINKDASYERKFKN